MPRATAVERILAPLDGSPLAEYALPYITEIARRTGAEVVLACSITPLATWDPATVGVRWDKEEETARAYLEALRERLAGEGLNARVLVMWGDAAACINKAAADESAGLIAMTTHGRSGIARLALGSVAAKVMHESVAPLLVVRAAEGDGQGPAAIRRILAPLDGSQLSQAVLPFVAEFAKALGASVIIHHAITPPAMFYPGLEMAPIDQRLASDIQRAAERIAERGAEVVRAAGAPVETLVTSGFAVDEIARAAEEKSADLIAMSTHGRSGLGRWVMGSVADAVVRRTTLPCLLVRPEQVKQIGREESREAGSRPGLD